MSKLSSDSLCNVCKTLSEVKREMKSHCQDTESPKRHHQGTHHQGQQNHQTHQNQDQCQENQQQGAFDEQQSFMLSRQINTELGAFYNYLSLFAHFDRDDVALKGFAQYYLRQAYEELEHALKLIRYMNKRGGRPKFCEIRAPERQVFCDAREALQTAMETEKKETCHLVELHAAARTKQDDHLAQFLVSDFMEHQLDSMNELGSRLTQLNMVGDGAGLYMYDRHLQKEERKHNVQKFI